jgi:phosphoribosylformylglycinamidine cyclo-ligase
MAGVRRTSDDPRAAHAAYRGAGVDTDEAALGLGRLVARITRSWPRQGDFGAVQLPIGYFANVIDIGGTGLALCTDGVGSKAILAQAMNCYDTIGIDCVAVNVNDLICVGARPLSLVDYIAVERVDAQILEAIGVGLDLAGTAVGTVPLDRIVTGRNLQPGDSIIGIESSGIHSNGLTLARKAFFKRGQPLSYDYPLPKTGVTLGQELLRPTSIYVHETMEIIARVPDVKALINITSDGLLNLSRVDHPRVGFRIDELPPVPEIFELIQQYGSVSTAEMFEVYNMGVGFCVLVDPSKASLVLSILEQHGRKAWVIGEVNEDPTKGVYLPRHQLSGHGKHFREG